MTEWTMDGNLITDQAVLARLKKVIEDESDLIVEHRYYRGARAPNRFVCASGDALEEYVLNRAAPGDSFFIWAFESCCTDEKILERGKVPDVDGRTPKGGAY